MVFDWIPLPLVSLRLNGRLVSCEPFPINAVAVTEPEAVVFPLNITLKASLATPTVPFPITKAVLSRLNTPDAPIVVSVKPASLYWPITKEPQSLAVVRYPIAVEAFPLAVVSYPIAVELIPLAVVLYPIAEATGPEGSVSLCWTCAFILNEIVNAKSVKNCFIGFIDFILKQI